MSFIVSVFSFCCPYFCLILCRTNANLPILANATPFIGKLNVLIFFSIFPSYVFACMCVCVIERMSADVCPYVCLPVCAISNYIFKLCFLSSSCSVHFNSIRVATVFATKSQLFEWSINKAKDHQASEAAIRLGVISQAIETSQK